MTDQQPLSDRVALVTGATRGIGRASAFALSVAGAHVIAVGRTQGSLEDLDDECRGLGGSPITLVPLDLSNGDGIDQLGLAISQRFGRLDVMVHAAGVLLGLRPVLHIPPTVWDRVVATNITASYRLIRAMEPLFRASDRPRAIFLTAEQATHPTAFWGSFAASKAALEALVRCWADEVDDTPIRAILLDPGPMRTKMRTEAFPGEEPGTLANPSALGPMIVELATATDPGPPTAVQSFISWASARYAAGSGTPSPDR